MSLPRWPKVTLFDDPDEEMRVAAMREALRNGTFDEAEPYLGTPPGFATLLTDPPTVPRRFDSHGLESEDDGAGPFDGLKRYAQATRHEALSVSDAAPGESLGPVTMNPHLFSKPPEAQLANKERVSNRFERFANKSVGQVMGGVNDAVYNTLRTLDPIVAFLEEKVGHLPRYTHPGIKAAETEGGALVRDTARFLTGFVPFVKALRAAGAGELGATLGAAGLSEALTRSPTEENLVDLLDKHKELRKPIYGFLNEILGRDPNDVAVFTRAENAAIGALVARGLENRWSRKLIDAVKLVGIARHAGMTMEALVIRTLQGGAHNLTEKGIHAILPHHDKPHPPGEEAEP